MIGVAHPSLRAFPPNTSQPLIWISFSLCHRTRCAISTPFRPVRLHV